MSEVLEVLSSRSGFAVIELEWDEVKGELNDVQADLDGENED